MKSIRDTCRYERARALPYELPKTMAARAGAANNPPARTNPHHPHNSRCPPGRPVPPVSPPKTPAR